VDATFKESLKRVTIKSSPGKTENSRGWLIYMETIRIKRPIARFNAINRSITGDGNGKIITIRIAITPSARKTSL